MDLTRLNILVVDDDPELRNFLVNGLHAMGHRVEAVPTASDGLSIMQKHSEQNPWDVMITDLNLPDHDGIWLLKAAKAINAGLVVLIITGYGSVETAVETLQMGAVDYLQKPFKLETLKVKIEHSIKTQRLSVENNQLKRDLALYRIYDLFASDTDIDKLLNVTMQSLNHIISEAAIKIVLNDGKQVANNNWIDDYELVAMQASLEAKGIKYGMIYIKPLNGNLDAEQRTGLALLSKNVSMGVENISLSTHVRNMANQLEAQRTELLDSYKYAILGEISSSLVHEMRNPLSAITLGVEYFGMSLGTDNKLQRSLGSISKSVERLNGILDSLSLYNKDSHDTKSTVLISDIINKAVGLVNYYLSGRKVRINIDRGDYEKPVLVNSGQMQQVLVDIMVFQGKRLADGGVINISITHCQEDMAISISCPSLEIPSQELSDLKEPFGPAWKPRMDLSISLARRLLQENNCRFDLTSQSETGTVMEINFEQYASEEGKRYGQAI